MAWAKIVLLIIFTIVLTKCLVIVNPDSVLPSVTDNSTKSKQNNSYLLSSVYDAMKYNDKVQVSDKVPDNNLVRIGPPGFIAPDYRNKRNTNNIERSDYYYANLHDPYSNNIRYDDGENEQITPKSGMICHNRPQAKENEYSISITQGMSSVAFTVGKIIFGLIAILVLPIFLFKAILIPFIILLGVKKFTAVNSLILGGLIWRFLRNSNFLNSGDGNENDDDADGGDTDGGNNLPSMSNLNQINSEYGEIDLRDAKRILKYVNEKSKDW